jgi:hypothetical protein
MCNGYARTPDERRDLRPEVTWRVQTDGVEGDRVEVAGREAAGRLAAIRGRVATCP